MTPVPAALRPPDPRPGGSASTVMDEVAHVRALLDAHRTGQPAPSRPVERAPEVRRLAELFGLSDFETDLLLLATAVELDGETAQVCARLQDVPGSDPRPSFALGLAVLADAHWDALSPERPLRRWGLLQLAPGWTLATRPLSVDEQVLHELTGSAGGDGDLRGVVRHLPPDLPLSPVQASLADGLADGARAVTGDALVRIVGSDADTVLAASVHVAARLGRRALLVSTDALPGPGPALATLAMLVDRCCLLRGAVPVLTGPESALPELLSARVVVQTSDGAPVPGRYVLRRDVALPDADEQRLLWRRALHLDEDDGPLPAVVEEVAQHFRFSAATLAGVAQEADRQAETEAGLHALCRDRARVSLEGLAERVAARACWDDLVLPDGQTRLLRDLVEHVRHRDVVHRSWGFAAREDRGLGVTALFSGESGTGKTMAAEVIAGDLGLDLYRIDLSAVVSKYIGETEKNLRRVFDAAESGGAVLLFDEADALFGKRGEVRDGHDRYANLEVSYLLQRMEAYRGLAVLTTNLRSNVDRAFLRRLRFVVQFPFPDEALRERIWRRAFPAATPLDGLDPAALARLQVSGGSIRAIAVGAAFSAAAAGTAISPRHVLHAAGVEYAKAERRLTDAETAAVAAGRLASDGARS